MNSSTDAAAIADPPGNFRGIARHLGPGMIIAATIVGSGELIGTTKTGAQAGMPLLWLIIAGCLIKVFSQVELGRYAISSGETTLTALNRVPGPRFIVNWIVWYWLVMMLSGFGQLGGIVGGVGQALSLSIPITGDYSKAIACPSVTELKYFLAWSDDIKAGETRLLTLTDTEQRRVRRSVQVIQDRLDILEKMEPGRPERSLNVVRNVIQAEKSASAAGRAIGTDPEVIRTRKEAGSVVDPPTRDDKYWSIAVAIVTAFLLLNGRYGLIQNFSTVLVVAFTFITIGNVFSLQLKPEFAIPVTDILAGLIPSLPEPGVAPPELPVWNSVRPLATALATFGIIGVGASELVSYPYWCLEKGYARHVGPKDGSPEWYRRAGGWVGVMKWDAFCSMLVYTAATLAFFFMGVAVMYQQGLDPEGMRMMSTLLEQYVPVFGEHARWLFLIGAFAVLYSTFLVANAGYTRMYTDCFKLLGLIRRDDPQAHRRSVAGLAVVLPLIALAVYCLGFNPDKLVLLGGTMQAIMLPMLGLAALYLRFTKTDAELRPGRVWDVCLVISFIGLLVAGGWGAWSSLK